MHPVCKVYKGFNVSQAMASPLQCPCLENPMDRGGWWAVVHGVTKSRAWLSGFTFTFHFHALEKEMAAHSSVLAWRIPGTGEPGGLPSMESHRVGHDWSDLAAAAAVSKLTIANPLQLYPLKLVSLAVSWWTSYKPPSLYQLSFNQHCFKFFL